MMDNVCPDAAAPDSGRPLSRAEEAARLGLRRSQYFALLARERAGEAGWLTGEAEALPHVPIVDGPVRRGYHYRLDDEAASRLPLGLMRIGADGSDRTPGSGRRMGRPGRLEGRLAVRHFNEVLGERPAEKKAPPKFRPKRPPKKARVP